MRDLWIRGFGFVTAGFAFAISGFAALLSMRCRPSALPRFPPGSPQRLDFHQISTGEATPRSSGLPDGHWWSTRSGGRSG